MVVSGQLDDLDALAPSTHWVEGWVEPRTGLDKLETGKSVVPVGNRTTIPRSSSHFNERIPGSTSKKLRYFSERNVSSKSYSHYFEVEIIFIVFL